MRLALNYARFEQIKEKDNSDSKEKSRILKRLFDSIILLLKISFAILAVLLGGFLMVSAVGIGTFAIAGPIVLIHNIYTYYGFIAAASTLVLILSLCYWAYKIRGRINRLRLRIQKKLSVLYGKIQNKL